MVKQEYQFIILRISRCIEDKPFQQTEESLA